jgi:hypothetical protein
LDLNQAAPFSRSFALIFLETSLEASGTLIGLRLLMALSSAAGSLSPNTRSTVSLTNADFEMPRRLASCDFCLERRIESDGQCHGSSAPNKEIRKIPDLRRRADAACFSATSQNRFNSGGVAWIVTRPDRSATGSEGNSSEMPCVGSG